MAEPGLTLPEYDQPPVFETVLGVQFSVAREFPTRLFGAHWERIKSRFPHIEIQPPIAPAFEELELPLAPPRFGLQFVAEPQFRCWFIGSSETKLLQVQRDRFLHNWRKVKEEDVYPHYHQIKPKFEEEWIGFRAFLSQEGFEKPEVNQCEITYVNHIEIGDDWKGLGELNKAIACWSGIYSGDFLEQPETLSLNVSYVMPGKKGRLHIAAQPAIRRQDAKEVLQLTLTARGKPASSHLEDISGWLDLGHEWIVRGFTDFTTEKMHELWGRKL
ncbi:MAG: hypothetical protein HW407_2338 [Bacteroidetes bacterium]|nr:hypothetical protein [Bacteroidota bacterium]